VLASQLDHIAVAVPDLALAEDRWVRDLGGRLHKWYPHPDQTFLGQQYRFANGASLELIAETPHGSGFLSRFLARFGAAIHHVTLMVDDLHEAIRTVRRHGLDVVDVWDELEGWKEAFLRPSQVGGIVVQLAWEPSPSTLSVEAGMIQDLPTPPGAAGLLGVHLQHPDLVRAAQVWSVLGGEVDATDDRVTVRWESNPVSVTIQSGEPAGALALRMVGTPDLSRCPVAGPPVHGDPPAATSRATPRTAGGHV
jgi:catechol 2,3-dioxygenase-like lactoylglutathione lyase family enzyme